MTCALSSGTAGDRTTNLSRRICSHHGPCPACGYSHGCSDQLSPLRSSADTDTSIRIPMRRTADHRSGKKGSPMDGHNIVSFRRGSWIVSRVVLPCGPGCQSTMSHGSTHGLIRAHTRWHPDLSTCTVAFRSGTTGSLRNSSLGCLCANLLVVSTDPTVHGRKASLARLPSPRVGTA